MIRQLCVSYKYIVLSLSSIIITLQFDEIKLSTNATMKFVHPCMTVRRNFSVLSTTSSQTLETPSKSVASGSDCSASRDSTSTSVQRSASSPDRHALRRNANAKLSAAREPTSARPDSGWSECCSVGDASPLQLLDNTDIISHISSSGSVQSSV